MSTALAIAGHTRFDGERKRAFENLIRKNSITSSQDGGLKVMTTLCDSVESNHRRLVCTIVLGLFITPLVNPIVALPRYTITDLGSLGGGGSAASDINNKGQVCGWSTTRQGKTHAFRYTDGVGMEDLGVPKSVAADSSYGYGINDRGQVVGESGGDSFRYTDGVGIENLTAAHCGFFDACLGRANAINNAGQVIGWENSNATGVQRRAIRFTDQAAKQIFGVLAGDNYSAGTDINDAGQVVGVSYDALDRQRAFRFTDGLGMMFLGTLGGSINSGGEYSWETSVSVANAINTKGQVTGKSSTTSLRWHGFLYTDGGRMEDLGVLQGDDASSGLDINDNGLIVGVSWNTNGGPSHPVLWTRPGCPEDLNLAPGVKESGWTLGDVNAINKNGQIVGTGKNPAGQSRAFRLTPLEPYDASQCPVSGGGTGGSGTSGGNTGGNSGGGSTSGGTGGGGTGSGDPAGGGMGGNSTGGSAGSSGDGGGGCAINANAGFDWSLVIMLLFGLGLRLRRHAIKTD